MINTSQNNKVEETRRAIQPINENKNVQVIKNINDNQNLNAINPGQENKEINNDFQRGPMDRIRKTNDKNSVNIEKNIEKEPKNNENNNRKNKIEKQNINIENQIQTNYQEKTIKEKYKYFVQPTNQSIEFVNNTNYIQNTSQNFSKENLLNPQIQISSKIPQETKIQSQQQVNTSNIALISQTNPIDEQISYQNEQLEEDQIPQNSQRKQMDDDTLSQKNIDKIQAEDIQEEGEDPKILMKFIKDQITFKKILVIMKILMIMTQ